MISLVLWTHLALCGQVPATPSQNVATEARLLVRKLNADDLADRDAAQQALVKLGPSIIQLLPQIDARTPADVAVRLGQIKQTLLTAQATSAGQASLITLKADDMPLAKVLAELAKQSGNAIVDHRTEFGEEVTEPKLTFDFNRVPFWEALDKVLDDSGLAIYPHVDKSGIYVVNQPPGRRERAGNASISGPFRIEATRFEAIRDLRNPQGRSLKLYMDVAWEPRLTPILISQPLDQVRATGNNGEPLGIDGAEGEPEADIHKGETQVELQIPLSLPDRKVTEITSLRGKLTALVPGAVETFRFDQLPMAKAGPVQKVEQRKGGVTVFVDSVRKNEEIWEVRMRVKFDQPFQSLESHRSWMFGNEALLVGPDGKQVESGGYEQTRETKDEFGVMYLFELDAPPDKVAFVYKTPIAMLTVPIEYELKNLELP